MGFNLDAPVPSLENRKKTPHCFFWKSETLVWLFCFGGTGHALVGFVSHLAGRPRHIAVSHWELMRSVLKQMEHRLQKRKTEKKELCERNI